MSTVRQADVNRDTWKQAPTVREFTTDGFSDEGERAAYAAIADEVRGRPILDIGVGAGRTLPLLVALSGDYVGIDYTPEMVTAARARYPAVDLRVADARDLSAFPDGSFRLVAFSYNGIDAVEHQDRARIVREVARVLTPGGIFWFSTLNHDGIGPRQRPWRPIWPEPRAGAARFALDVLRTIKGVPRAMANYRRSRPLWADGDGWSVRPLIAHSFGLVVHYTTLARQIEELEAAGFTGQPEVYESSFGRRISPTDDLHDVFWFQIVARKRS